MRSYVTALTLYVIAALILRAGINTEDIPLPKPKSYRSSIFNALKAPKPKPLHKITAYCTCPLCCSAKWSDGITASGTIATEGRTIAADTSVWPIGTCLVIPGVGRRIVEDTGSAIMGRALDVFIDDHDRARTFGVRVLPVGECDA